METEIKRRMTIDEIALLKELARWRRNHEVKLGPGEYRFPEGRLITWLSPRSYATCMKIAVTTDRRRKPLTWYRVQSIRQAVDLLVVLGYLPLRFSSAYRAGWDAATLWHGVSDRDDQTAIAFAKAFHDPNNISFPAGDPVW